MILNLPNRVVSTTRPILLIAVGALLSFQNLSYYLRFDFNLILTLMALPVCITVERHHRGSWRYAVLSVGLLALYPVLKVQSLFFLGFCSFVLFIIDHWMGKINHLPMALLLVSSPFALFAMEVIGFPLRLELTQWAAFCCRWFEPNLVAEGNRLLLGEEVFRVDPECMGLKLMNTTFVLGLAFLAYFQRKRNQFLPLSFIPAWGLLSLLLVLIGNLIRIVLIVFFRAMPETPLHEIIGLVTWLVYTLLPLLGLTYGFLRFWGKPTEAKTQHRSAPFRNGVLMTLLLLGLLTGININRDEFRNRPKQQELATRELPGFTRKVNDHQVVQYENDLALIYVKPGVHFYGADHTPLICWKGSGYQFRNERILTLGEQQIFAAELLQNDSKLFTAWWYDNGSHQTISQWDWRWRMAKGEPSFRLINLTCSSEEELHHQLQSLLSHSLIPDSV
ncbi:exosortase N [bacterium SCSIO 12741]|nr:exosortase N [bacterium SCSIO 12741]